MPWSGGMVTRKCRRILVALSILLAAVLLYLHVSQMYYVTETLPAEWIRHPPHLFDNFTLNQFVTAERNVSLHRDPTADLTKMAIANNTVVDIRYFRFIDGNLRTICRDQKFSVFIYINSATFNYQRRELLRTTWLNVKTLQKYNIGYLFFTGTVSGDDGFFHKEHTTYNDIVQVQYKDNYKQMSKKAAATLTWVAEHCAPHVPIIIKADDDMFVNIPLLMMFLRKRFPFGTNEDNRTILCNVQWHTTAIRKADSKWYVSKESYSKQYYPPFCPGSVLVMTSYAVRTIRLAMNGSTLFPIDDVWLTGILTQGTGVQLVGINRLYLNVLRSTVIYREDLFTDFLFAHCTLHTLHLLWNVTSMSHVITLPSGGIQYWIRSMVKYYFL